ncbi:hypothetical protein GGTG_13289 [Gaeumannomyces tritici R3-111a-1]|uniref:Uncharacterized protein n=1 Tax=Gaeumannomyces tritici (strain R3-111a-1) TaxID=644352 RepID=J3PIG1_GAET3|nr:hypothetical protein GGTG_13289 [Gaeumannomyces tritici R3-111a-1]EJT69180.1 hypothetical protein GGTG_13289 [Gaeumannomyces tritici R3-111a-1]
MPSGGLLSQSGLSIIPAGLARPGSRDPVHSVVGGIHSWIRLADFVQGNGSARICSVDIGFGQVNGGPPDDFWRTLVADRGRDSRNPPYYYKQACKESIYKGGLRGGSVNTSDLINNGRNSIVAQFCRRVQAVIWNRSMVKTDQGNLGIAAKGVRQGDLVCILYGCSVPVILRERQKSQEEQDENSGEEEMMQDVKKIMRRGMATMKSNRRRKTAYKGIPELRQVSRNVYYEFLGECYIHGMMDGEAMARKANSEEAELEKWDQFTLFRKEQKEQASTGEPEDAKKRASKIPEELRKKAKEVQDEIAKRTEYHQKRKATYEGKLQEWEEHDKRMDPRVYHAKPANSCPIATRRTTVASTSGLSSRGVLRQPTLMASDDGLGAQPARDENDGDDDGDTGGGGTLIGGGSSSSNGTSRSSYRTAKTGMKSPEPLHPKHFGGIDQVREELMEWAEVKKAPERLRKRAEARPEEQAEADGWDFFRDKMLCDTIFELR